MLSQLIALWCCIHYITNQCAIICYLLIEYTSQKCLGLLDSGLEKKSCLHHCWQMPVRRIWTNYYRRRASGLLYYRTSRVLEYWLKYSNEYSNPKYYSITAAPMSTPHYLAGCQTVCKMLSNLPYLVIGYYSVAGLEQQ